MRLDSCFFSYLLAGIDEVIHGKSQLTRLVKAVFLIERGIAAGSGYMLWRMNQKGAELRCTLPQTSRSRALRSLFSIACTRSASANSEFS